ncbi:MAG: DinB family protein [Anaerolineae bacterium]|jgi:uncharacterized damage-inducible protein DinB
MNAADRFRHWQSVRRGLIEALDKINDEQLQFVPRAGLWSLGKVACHIADAEDGWFRYVATGELDAWPEFEAEDYPTVESVKRVLAEVHGRTEAYLATLDDADLEQIIAAPWGNKLPLRWIVWHVLEHEISHRGEIYLMLGLMGMEAPDV